jgi:hypothetical protein
MNIEQIIDVDKFTQEIQEEINDLDEAFRTQTGRAAYYAMLYAKAQKQADDVELRVKLVEAQLTKIMREKLNEAARQLADEEGSKPERITVDMVKAEVLLHPEMRKWLQMQIDADEIKRVCAAASDAFRTRREMLTSIGMLTREQMRANFTIQGAKGAQTVRDRHRQRLERRQQQQEEAETTE